MAKFVFGYHSRPTSDGGNDEAWGKWFGQLGDKLVDPGNPFADGGQAVHAGGVMAAEGKLATGYTIVNADSMDEATEMAKGCPLIADKHSAVCVYEALPM